MIFGAGLRSRLSELARTRRFLPGTVAEPLPWADVPHESEMPPAAFRPHDSDPSFRRGRLDSYTTAEIQVVRIEPDRLGVEAFLPGGEWSDGEGAVFVHERLRSEIERARPHWGRLDEPPEREIGLARVRELGLARALFLDLETGGLASSPVFLAGTMHWNGEDFVLRQYFARHYGEEAALLRALASAFAGFDAIVTFNGKSYDVPFLRDRARLHRITLPIPIDHLDLLHPARRRWRAALPDCRLQTLEFAICRRRRVGDVPGDEVPGLYHDFVRRGDPYRLIPVFHHNLLDVITMAEVLRALCAPARELAMR